MKYPRGRVGMARVFASMSLAASLCFWSASPAAAGAETTLCFTESATADLMSALKKSGEIKFAEFGRNDVYARQWFAERGRIVFGKEWVRKVIVARTGRKLVIFLTGNGMFCQQNTYELGEEEPGPALSFSSSVPSI